MPSTTDHTDRDRTEHPQGKHGARIVVIGAGYAGLFATRRAARAVGHGASRLTLIDPSAAWVERTRLHQVAVGDTNVAALTTSDLFDPTQVESITGTVRSIDTDQRTLTVEIGATADQDTVSAPGAHQGAYQRADQGGHIGGNARARATGGTTAVRVDYDRLIYAVGSTTDTSGVPGAQEHAFVLDTSGTSHDLDRRLATLGYSSPGRGSSGRVAVVGGGLTGIETATEIAEAHPQLSVTLVTAGELGVGVSERGRRHLRRAMDRFGVDVLEKTAVARIDQTGLSTATGRRVEADVMVWAAGFDVPDLASRAGLATDERGRVLVDATLRSISHPEILAAGDGAWPVEPVGAPVRPSAYVATIMGAHAGTNLARELAGKQARPLRFGYLMQSISLGRRDGLIQFTNGADQPLRLIATGRIAAAIKEFVERVMVVGLLRLERRVPGAFAWRPAPRRPASSSG